MTKKTFTVVIPGAETPEGRARIQREIEARNEIDYRGYMKLSELREMGVLSYENVLRAIKEDWSEGDDWTPEEAARDLIEEIDQLIHDRRMADHYVLGAIAGRPDDRVRS